MAIVLWYTCMDVLCTIDDISRRVFECSARLPSVLKRPHQVSKWCEVLDAMHGMNKDV